MAKVDLVRIVAAERLPVATRKRARDDEYGERELVLQKNSN
jgi:hypothetical protein